MTAPIRFVDDSTILFSRNGATHTLEMLETYAVDQVADGFRTELLAWAQIAATRENTAKLASLMGAIQAMALGAHDQAAATREQTEKMQGNIDDARADATTVEEVFAMVANGMPDVMKKIAAATGMPLEELLGGKAREVGSH